MGENIEIEKKKFRGLYILLAFIQSALTSGIIFGWPALQLILLKDDTFESHCGDDTMRPCKAQSMYFNTIYTSAIFANNISPLFMGAFLDKFGPKLTNLVGFVLFFIGCIPFILKVEYIYVVGYALLGFSGPGIYVSIMHLNNLYPGHQPFILTIFSGTFGISSLVFKLFLIFFRPNTWLDIPTLFIIFMIALAPIFLLGLFVWPMKPFEPPPAKTEEVFNPGDSGSLIKPSRNNVYNASLRTQLGSARFWLPLIWISFQALRVHSYLGSVPVEFMNHPTYVSDFNWIWLGSVITIPLFGVLLDKYGTTPSFFIFSALFLLFSVVSLSPNLQIQYLAFALVAIANVGVWGVLYSYLSFTFGNKNYGKLLGVVSGVIAVSGLIQYPLLSINIDYFEYNFFYTDAVFTGISIVLFLVPFYLWNMERKKKVMKPLLSINSSDYEERESLISSAGESESESG